MGFAFSHLLDFKLLPRLKNIGSVRLYRPGLTEGEAWPQLEGVLSGKTIDWELIANQYDQMIKYATALRLGTAEAHQMLRPVSGVRSMCSAGIWRMSAGVSGSSGGWWVWRHWSRKWSLATVTSSAARMVWATRPWASRFLGSPRSRSWP
ncbi:Tn3 family transposase [Nonomuraea jabiensis]|uniref:Tn3 family transposase n=1 Tax=Nonomuraea jabiensis TaxID=882448 RepID=UPI003448AD23